MSELASIWINSLFSFNHKNPPCFSLSFFSFVMGSVCGQFVFIGFYFIFISSYLYLHTHTLTNPEVWTYILGAIHSYIYKVYEILPFFFSSIAYIEIVHFRLRLFAGAIGDIALVVVMGLLLANG